MSKRDFYDPARQPNVRVTLTLPLALLDAVDAEAERIGVGRSALVVYWLQQQLARPGARRPVRPRRDDEATRAK